MASRRYSTEECGSSVEKKWASREDAGESGSDGRRWRTRGEKGRWREMGWGLYPSRKRKYLAWAVRADRSGGPSARPKWSERIDQALPTGAPASCTEPPAPPAFTYSTPLPDTTIRSYVSIIIDARGQHTHNPTTTTPSSRFATTICIKLTTSHCRRPCAPPQYCPQPGTPEILLYATPAPATMGANSTAAQHYLRPRPSMLHSRRAVLQTTKPLPLSGASMARALLR